MAAFPGVAPTRSKKSGRAARRSFLHRTPGLASSLVVHGALLVLLGLVALPQAEKATDLWLDSAGAAADSADFDPVDFSADADATHARQDGSTVNNAPDALATESLAGLVDPGVAPLGELADGATAGLGGLGPTIDGGELGRARGGGGGFGESGALFGAPGGTGGGTSGEGLGGAPTAKFFGARIEGRRIVFVLDNSGSMTGGRLETVIDELERCVDALTPKQEFYVFFYSDAVYPLYYPHPVMQYIRANEQTKQRLAAWLKTVELSLGDKVVDALEAAASIEPDTVFLLSDGRIAGERKLQYLMASGQRGFPIHTIAVGLGTSSVGRRNLEMIAEANRGQFREAEVPDAMRELALKSPRPYHREGPGAVWGRNVRVLKRRGG